VTESAPARTIPPLRMRVAIALAIGLFCALLVVIGAEHALPTSDFDQCWVAARALLHGHNPYDMIGPGRAFAWRFPFFYPLPAALIAMPFAWFEVSVTRALFISISAALLAFAITRRVWPVAHEPAGERNGRRIDHRYLAGASGSRQSRARVERRQVVERRPPKRFA